MASEGGPSEEHQAMFAGLLEILEREVSTRKAATLPGYEQPKERNGYIPDAEGYGFSRVHFAEVKTADDIDNDHAHAQYRAFTGWTMPETKLPVPFLPNRSSWIQKRGYLALRNAGVYHEQNTIVMGILGVDFMGDGFSISGGIDLVLGIFGGGLLVWGLFAGGGWLATVVAYS
ncbi:MAG: hypothetical protein U0R44_02550 [Candidatus Micrarchaeia archaeon]